MNLDGNDSMLMSGKRKSGAMSWVFLAAVAVFALTLAVSCGGASGNSEGQKPAGGAQEEPSAEGQALGREPLGEANAPVVLTEYADYQ